MTDLLDWTHRTSELPERGLQRERSASAEIRLRIANALGLIACEKFVLDYALRPIAGDAVSMTGTLDAHVTQACVVSLEPLPATVLEKFSVEFHHDATKADPESGDAEILKGPDIEPIENGIIDVGRIAFETLSSALDPYPRKDGTTFAWSDPKAAIAQTHPFAALKKLKKDE